MLKGNLITLYPLSSNELDQTRAWANDIDLNAGILRVWPVTEPDQERWYRNILEDPSKLVFAVKTIDTAKHIGNTGFYNIDLLHRRAEFWMIIGDSDYRGKGIGSEIVSLMLNYGFEFLNLNRIFLHVRKDNIKAVNIYENANFTAEGLLRQHFYIRGEYVDVMVMGILRNHYGK